MERNSWVKLRLLLRILQLSLETVLYLRNSKFIPFGKRNGTIEEVDKLTGPVVADLSRLLSEQWMLLD
jgi:hypothetical protein